jgi:uncharacterized protein (TIGR02145 family)
MANVRLKKIITTIFLFCCSYFCIAQNVIEKKYKEAKIGDQIWMAENLNVSKFRNGDVIPEAKTNEEWIRVAKEKQPAWCYYNNDVNNGNKFGKLYNAYAVRDPRGLAPKGWHIPSTEEWDKLCIEISERKSKSVGLQLKSKMSWQHNGDNCFGFDALPAGFRAGKDITNSLGERIYKEASFVDLGKSCVYWTNTRKQNNCNG